jgi:hypothetical protein
MPAASIWGPYLWKFLHSFAAIVKEREDKQTKFKKSEESEARWIVNNIDKIIPCKECLAHVLSFKKSMPFTPKSDYALWFWSLHESVNQKLGKPPGPPLEEVSTGEVGALWKEYVKCVEDSILQNHIRRIHVIEFQRHVYMWLNYLV